MISENMKISDKKNIILPAIVGLALLIIIFINIGTKNIFSVFKNISLKYFFLAAFFYICSNLVASVKISFFSKLKMKKIFFSHVGGMLLSQLTPGRIGYFYTSYSLAKKENKSVSSYIGIIGFLQAVSMFAKAMLTIFALIYFSRFFIIPSAVANAFWVPLLFILAMIVLLFTNIPNKILGKKFENNIKLLQQGVRKLGKPIIAKWLVLDFVAWLFLGAQWYFLARSVAIPIGYIFCLFLHPLITAIMFIPVSPTALGIAEGGMAVLFNLLKLGSASGVGFMVLIRINTFIADSVGLIDLKNVPKFRLDKIVRPNY